MNRMLPTVSPCEDKSRGAATPSPAEMGGDSTISALAERSRSPNWIALLKRELGDSATEVLVPMQPGDLPGTCADIDDLIGNVGFRLAPPIEDGARRFAAWYRAFHHISSTAHQRRPLEPRIPLRYGPVAQNNLSAYLLNHAPKEMRGWSYSK